MPLGATHSMTQELTGIERQLVLDYLIAGNAPITLTPIEAFAFKKTVKPDASKLFPIARAEQLENRAVLLLKASPQAVQAFAGKKVKVQFYFHKLGLYFVTTPKEAAPGLALDFPAVINRIPLAAPPKNAALTAMLYYTNSQPAQQLVCQLAPAYPLFVQPQWSDIDESIQEAAKVYLERAIASSRSSGTAIGNGLFLIPVCHYLAHKDSTVQALAERAEPPTVLFINHERIIFGYTLHGYKMQQGCEYTLKLGFPLQTPVKERAIYITCEAEALYTSDDNERSCACCRYTSIKEEDVRFLYELQNKHRKLQKPC